MPTLEDIYAKYRNMPRGMTGEDRPIPLDPQTLQPLPEPSILGQDTPQMPKQSFGSMLGQQARGLLGNQDLALALLANSGYSPEKRSFGQVFGQSALQANEMKQGREDNDFKRQYMTAQLQRLQQQGASPFGAISPDKFTAESIAQFEKTGKYSDLVQAPMQRQQIDTAQIRNDQYRRSLKTDAERRVFDDIMRQNYDVVESGGVQNVVRKGPEPNIRPLNTLANEAGAAATIKAAEAQAGAIGAGQGGVIADIQKKGANAKTINGVLDIADPLIDAATGSLVGAGADKLAAAFGKAPEGAQAIAQLQVLQAGLMLNQPRMEGPQSDRDVELYRQAAGSLGDPTVPRETKKAALRTIRMLQDKYTARSQQPFQLNPGSKELTYDPATGTFK